METGKEPQMGRGHLLKSLKIEGLHSGVVPQSIDDGIDDTWPRGRPQVVLQPQNASIGVEASVIVFNALDQVHDLRILKHPTCSETAGSLVLGPVLSVPKPT